MADLQIKPRFWEEVLPFNFKMNIKILLYGRDGRI